MPARVATEEEGGVLVSLRQARWSGGGGISPLMQLTTVLDSRLGDSSSRVIKWIVS